MEDNRELEDGYLDLKINKYIGNFRKQYENEYLCIKKINNYLYKIQNEIEKKGVSQQNVFIMASLTEIQKIFCSSILLFERGLPESANILIRSILELSFKIIEVIRNEDFVEDLLLVNLYEELAIINKIEESKLFDIVPQQETIRLKQKYKKEINGRIKPNAKPYYLAKRNNLNKEYILYKLQCEHSHQSIKIIGDIIEITDEGVIINGDLRLDEFKSSIAWILSIIAIAVEVILKEYINNNILKVEFDEILIYFKDIVNR
ncbi:MAG: hypothetical protein IKF52_05540 [Clostridia bacterium]|nr:hypothetical protein [Clostridia bacterium]